MNHCNLQQNAAVSAYEEMRGLISISDPQKGGLVVCPKPRRIGVVANNPIELLRLHMSHQAEVTNSKAGVELLDIILNKVLQEDSGTAQVASSSPPPFFCGSPPGRAANPIVQDARFGDERLAQAFPVSGIPSPSSSACKGGSGRKKFGLKPAAVRVVGFDCLNRRDRRNSSIPAMA